MSITHFSSSSSTLPETNWWTQHQHQHHNHNHIMDFNHHYTQQQQQQQVVENNIKESMFEKPLTPSDVGKLNRLVIPKQHAEKYFPLSSDSDQQKGLLLSFEDETGKTWRFRYSYWNSSQSYVLTKGWSRFVKEKHLDAGDVVLFEKHRFESDTMFIGWRRRPAAVSPPVIQTAGGGGGSGCYYNYPSHHLPLPLSLPHPYQPDCLHAGGSMENKPIPRRVRLFGVNLDCPDESEPSTPDRSSQQQGQTNYLYSNNLNLNLFDNMNTEMRYHQNQG